MRIKHIRLVAVTTLGLGIMNAALAIGPGFYIQGQAGQSNTHNVDQLIYTNTTPATAIASPSNTGFGGRLSVGYQVNPYAGLEFGYTYYSASTYTVSSPTNLCSSPSTREAAIDLVGRGTLPVASTGFGVFGKAGVAVLRQSQSGSFESDEDGACGSSSSSTKVAPTAAVGASYDINQNWAADVSWARVFKGRNIQNADLYSVGISYHFVDKYCGQFLC